MKEIWKQFRSGAIAVSICMLALGVVMILWPDISALTICIILGIICIAAGIYTVVRYHKLGLAGIFFRSDLSFGICCILLGLLLLLHPYGALVFLPIAVGLFMMIGSVIDIQISVEMHRLHFPNWGITLALGIINILFAFLLLVNPFQGASVLMIFAGVSLVVSSLRNLYSVYAISKAVKASRSNETIELEWRAIDE